MPLPGHGDKIDTPNWACREYRTRKENLEVRQLHQGGQGQVGVPQVPLLGHEGELETPNWGPLQGGQGLVIGLQSLF